MLKNEEGKQKPANVYFDLGVYIYFEHGLMNTPGQIYVSTQTSFLTLDWPSTKVNTFMLWYKISYVHT